jgi:hypothetical protein
MHGTAVVVCLSLPGNALVQAIGFSLSCYLSSACCLNKSLLKKPHKKTFQTPKSISKTDDWHAQSDCVAMDLCFCITEVPVSCSSACAELLVPTVDSLVGFHTV